VRIAPILVETAVAALTATLITGVIAFVCALGAAPASAQPEGWSQSLSTEMMSPFCPGRTLSNCPSPQADSLRMWILVQESTGRTRADVEEELYERYGDIILAAPRAEGIGIAAYAVPVVAFLGGGGLILFLLRRLTARPAPVVLDGEVAEVEGEEPLDPELERIVAEELLQR